MWDKEGHCMLFEGLIHQEYTFVNVYALNGRDPDFIKQKAKQTKEVTSDFKGQAVIQITSVIASNNSWHQ